MDGRRVDNALWWGTLARWISACAWAFCQFLVRFVAISRGLSLARRHYPPPISLYANNPDSKWPHLTLQWCIQCQTVLRPSVKHQSHKSQPWKLTVRYR